MKEYLDSLAEMSRSQLLLMLARQRARQAQGLAVTGMACRLPGGIDGPAGLWAQILAGRRVADGSGVIPVDSRGRPRWNVSAPDLAGHADLLRRGSYLDDVDRFDADRFGLSAQEAEQMDPQQRLLLVCAADAMEDAGLAPDGDQRVGVFVAASQVEYPFAGLRNGVAQHLSPLMGVGVALSALAARVSVGLGLNGPSLTLDTACSSALTALHLAGAALRADECDVAVIGTAHLLLSPFTSVVFDQGGMLSPSGRSLPFTSTADGHVRAEGAGALILVRQGDLTAGGAAPYAVVRGSAIHQQGARPSLAAPSTTGQQRAIELALTRAEVDPLAVALVEAQANGSRLGAALEVETLAQAYQRDHPAAPPLWVASVKANLGYLETSSATISLIKTALALNARSIPPQPGADDLDSHITWEKTSIRVPPTVLPLPVADDGTAYAGVSAFAFTGTNAHAVLGSVPGPARSLPPDRPPTGPGHWSELNVWS